MVQIFQVEQESLIDTLRPGQHLLIDELTPRFDDYSRGDIVVFHPNGERDQTTFIERVIGVGGETWRSRTVLPSSTWRPWPSAGPAHRSPTGAS
jgi:signal peptidase I